MEQLQIRNMRINANAIERSAPVNLKHLARLLREAADEIERLQAKAAK